MPKVKVEKEAVVVARPGLHVVYQPGERLAPDAHIVEIIRQGKGERLTSRGNVIASTTPVEPRASTDEGSR